MPFFDRFWWLRLFAAALPAAALALVFWLLVRALPEIDIANVAGDAFVLAVIICLVIAVLVLATGARKARDRKCRRLAALNGDRDAVPASRIVPDLAGAPDVSQAPLLLTPPERRRDRPMLALARAWGSAAAAIFSIVLAATLFTPLFDWMLIRALIFLSPSLFPSVVSTRSAFRATYRAPRRIAVDALGITWEPILGHARVLRWDDARLLEVDIVEIAERWAQKKVERRRYTLYGRDTTIWWTEPEQVYARPSGQYAQLLDLIAKRTGLQPRTFSKALRAPPNPTDTDGEPVPLATARNSHPSTVTLDE